MLQEVQCPCCRTLWGAFTWRSPPLGPSASQQRGSLEQQAAVVHQRSRCTACAAAPIAGPRFACRTCASVSLCQACFAQGRHPEHHFLRYATATALGERADRDAFAPACVSLQAQSALVNAGAQKRHHRRCRHTGRGATAPAMRSGLERVHSAAHDGTGCPAMVLSVSGIRQLDTSRSVSNSGSRPQLSPATNAASVPVRSQNRRAQLPRRSSRRLQSTRSAGNTVGCAIALAAVNGHRIDLRTTAIVASSGTQALASHVSQQSTTEAVTSDTGATPRVADRDAHAVPSSLHDPYSAPPLLREPAQLQAASSELGSQSRTQSWHRHDDRWQCVQPYSLDSVGAGRHTSHSDTSDSARLDTGGQQAPILCPRTDAVSRAPPQQRNQALQHGAEVLAGATISGGVATEGVSCRTGAPRMSRAGQAAAARAAQARRARAQQAAAPCELDSTHGGHSLADGTATPARGSDRQVPGIGADLETVRGAARRPGEATHIVHCMRDRRMRDTAFRTSGTTSARGTADSARETAGSAECAAGRNTVAGLGGRSSEGDAHSVHVHAWCQDKHKLHMDELAAFMVDNALFEPQMDPRGAA